MKMKKRQCFRVNFLKEKGNESEECGINRILMAKKNMIKQTNPFNEEVL